MGDLLQTSCGETSPSPGREPKERRNEGGVDDHYWTTCEASDEYTKSAKKRVADRDSFIPFMEWALKKKTLQPELTMSDLEKLWNNELITLPAEDKIFSRGQWTIRHWGGIDVLAEESEGQTSVVKRKKTLELADDLEAFNEKAAESFKRARQASSSPTTATARTPTIDQSMVQGRSIPTVANSASNVSALVLKRDLANRELQKAMEIEREGVEDHEAKLLVKELKAKEKAQVSDTVSGRVSMRISIGSTKRSLLKFIKDKRADMKTESAAARSDLKDAFGDNVPDDFEAKLLDVDAGFEEAQAELQERGRRAREVEVGGAGGHVGGCLAEGHWLDGRGPKACEGGAQCGQLVVPVEAFQEGHRRRTQAQAEDFRCDHGCAAGCRSAGGQLNSRMCPCFRVQAGESGSRQEAPQSATFVFG